MPWSSETKYLHSYTHVINYLLEDKKLREKEKKNQTKKWQLKMYTTELRSLSKNNFLKAAPFAS